MNEKDIDSDFEAYREERNYRRRQRTKTERPHGPSNTVWEELNAHETALGAVSEQVLYTRTRIVGITDGFWTRATVTRPRSLQDHGACRSAGH